MYLYKQDLDIRILSLRRNHYNITSCPIQSLVSKKTSQVPFTEKGFLLPGVFNLELRPLTLPPAVSSPSP